MPRVQGAVKFLKAKFDEGGDLKYQRCDTDGSAGAERDSFPARPSERRRAPVRWKEQESPETIALKANKNPGDRKSKRQSQQDSEEVGATESRQDVETADLSVAKKKKTTRTRKRIAAPKPQQQTPDKDWYAAFFSKAKLGRFITGGRTVGLKRKAVPSTDASPPPKRIRGQTDTDVGDAAPAEDNVSDTESEDEQTGADDVSDIVNLEDNIDGIIPVCIALTWLKDNYFREITGPFAEGMLDTFFRTMAPTQQDTKYSDKSDPRSVERLTMTALRRCYMVDGVLAEADEETDHRLYEQLMAGVENMSLAVDIFVIQTMENKEKLSEHLRNNADVIRVINTKIMNKIDPADDRGAGGRRKKPPPKHRGARHTYVYAARAAAVEPADANAHHRRLMYETMLINRAYIFERQLEDERCSVVYRVDLGLSEVMYSINYVRDMVAGRSKKNTEAPPQSIPYFSRENYFMSGRQTTSFVGFNGSAHPERLVDSLRAYYLAVAVAVDNGLRAQANKGGKKGAETRAQRGLSPVAYITAKRLSELWEERETAGSGAAAAAYEQQVFAWIYVLYAVASGATKPSFPRYRFGALPDLLEALSVLCSLHKFVDRADFGDSEFTSRLAGSLLSLVYAKTTHAVRQDAMRQLKTAVSLSDMSRDETERLFGKPLHRARRFIASDAACAGLEEGKRREIRKCVFLCDDVPTKVSAEDLPPFGRDSQNADSDAFGTAREALNACLAYLEGVPERPVSTDEPEESAFFETEDGVHVRWEDTWPYTNQAYKFSMLFDRDQTIVKDIVTRFGDSLLSPQLNPQPPAPTK